MIGQRWGGGMLGPLLLLTAVPIVLADNSTVEDIICSTTTDTGSYNLGFAIASIFVVLVLSVVGFLTPIMLSLKQHRMCQLLIVASACGGSGVVLTVGFIHILADAEAFLSNPCLPQGFLNAYPDWAMLICNCTIVVLILADYVLKGYFEMKIRTVKTHRGEETGIAADMRSMEYRTASEIIMVDIASDEEEDAVHGDDIYLDEQTEIHLARGVIMLIEVSVCSHSIPVGLALGLQTGDAFTGLFIAVIFHQLLEGFGVGAAAMRGKYSMKMYIVLALCFGITAPLGIAIGIILHESLNQNSQAYLLTVGIVNAIAAGMLIYIALEHLNTLSSRGKWLRRQPWRHQLLCVSCFVLGSAALMIIGRWA